MGWLGEIAQLITAVVLFLNYLQSRENGQKIEAVHLATNSMKDALVDSTGKEAFARGVKSGEMSSMNINHRIAEVKDASYAEGLKHGEENPKSAQ
jgi:hypothetical protein